MTSNAPPSGNPANAAELTGFLRFAFSKMLQYTDDMLPARVVAYDRSTNRATVQPLIAMINTAGELIQRAQVASVPVLQLGGGGFVLSFPISPGDLGWIKANDRDISVFKATLTNSSPPTQRKHDFSDSMFIPDTMFKSVSISDEDEGNVVLQSLSGDVRIALFSDKVKITAPQIVLDTPLTTITGQIEAGTNPSYDRTATFNGDIHTTGDVVADTISLQTHVHNGVQPGSGDTGEPVP